MSAAPPDAAVDRLAGAITGVLVCHVAATALCFTAAEEFGPGAASAIAYELAAAVLTALVTLLATWIALGPGPTPRRVLYGIGYANAALTLHLVGALIVGDSVRVFGWSDLTRAVASLVAVVFVMFGSQLVGLTTLGLVLRSRGWRWTRVEPSGPRGVRFSLADALVTTTLLGLAFGVVRALGDHAESVASARSAWEPTLASCGLPLAFAIALAYHALSAAVVFGPRVRPWAIAAALVVATFAGWSIWFVLPIGGPPNDQRLALGAAASAALTIAYLLAFRAAGWRVDRRASKD